MMKNNNPLLIILILLSIGILFKVFEADSKTKEIRNELKIANEEIEKSLRISKDTEEEIDLLLKKIEKDYEKEIKELETERKQIKNTQRISQQKKKEDLKLIDDEINKINEERINILKEIEDDE